MVDCVCPAPPQYLLELSLRLDLGHPVHHLVRGRGLSLAEIGEMLVVKPAWVCKAAKRLRVRVGLALGLGLGLGLG